MTRLLDHLKSLGHGNHAARELLQHGKVWVEGFPTGDPARLVDPATVTVRPDAPRVVLGRDPLVVHADNAVAVVWKPPGVLTVSAPGRREEGSLPGLLGRRLGRLRIVHRLDEETSGLLVLARTDAAQEALKDAFEAHRVERRYLAIVAGEVPEAWVVRNELVRDRGDGLRGSVDEGLRRGLLEGKELHARQLGPARTAITHFRRVEHRAGATLVEARLETGRTHQVRIHLAEGGHPVLGDPLYGARRAFPRLALHAAVLGFDHPVTRVAMRFTCPLADDLAQAWRDREARKEARREPGRRREG